MQHGEFHKRMKFLFTLLEQVGLVVIAIATIFAAAHEIMIMINAKSVGLGDLLLMFLFVEVLAMVSFYYSSGKLPVTYPLYIGMVALARYIVLDIKELPPTHMLASATAILVLAIAVLLVRFGHLRLPYPEYQ